MNVAVAQCVLTGEFVLTALGVLLAVVLVQDTPAVHVLPVIYTFMHVHCLHSLISILICLFSNFLHAHYFFTKKMIWLNLDNFNMAMLFVPMFLHYI